MITCAPPRTLEFSNFTDAKFFSSKVFPIKVPKPNPCLEELILFKVLIYGSPSLSLSIKSFGKPSPSSSIIIIVLSILLTTEILTFF